MDVDDTSTLSETDYFMMAVNAYVHGAYDESIAYFDKVIDHDAKNARAYVNRGDVYAEIESYNEAFSDYAMAIALGSNQAYEVANECLTQIYAEKRINEASYQRFLTLIQQKF